MRAYKYKAASPVWSYDNIWSPLAERLLPLVPLGVAPNLLTIIAFAFSMAASVPLIYYGHERADWMVLNFAICLFIYQTLDNLDGKQARRTGSSSPLGMLFDHGLDTITAYSLTLSVAAMLGAHERFEITLLFVLISSGFYIATLWQYFTKAIDYGFYSPPDDGIPTLYLMALVIYFTGP